MLNDVADLDKVKQEILANPAKYAFPKIEKPEDSSDKQADTDNNIDDDHIYMSLYNPSHPVSNLGCYKSFIGARLVFFSGCNENSSCSANHIFLLGLDPTTP